ncbi:MAG TPA: membrane protein insertion efficiency factor YidD [Nitrospirae bacterium]|nr:membrane protein insertion efficiency factor YidD [Nitrospirota bacterium]
MKIIAIFVIRAYQYFISPLTPQVCKFVPSCSEYSMLAYKRYGFIRGTFLSLLRILRCNPLSKGGYDPVK